MSRSSNSFSIGVSWMIEVMRAGWGRYGFTAGGAAFVRVCI